MLARRERDAQIMREKQAVSKTAANDDAARHRPSDVLPVLPSLTLFRKKKLKQQLQQLVARTASEHERIDV